MAEEEKSTLEQLHRDVLDKLLPPAAGRLLGRPLLDVELAETSGQVHDGHCDDLRLPLQRQHGAQAADTGTKLLSGWVKSQSYSHTSGRATYILQLHTHYNSQFVPSLSL